MYTITCEQTKNTALLSESSRKPCSSLLNIRQPNFQASSWGVSQIAGGYPKPWRATCQPSSTNISLRSRFLNRFESLYLSYHEKRPWSMGLERWDSKSDCKGRSTVMWHLGCPSRLGYASEIALLDYLLFLPSPFSTFLPLASESNRFQQTLFKRAKSMQRRGQHFCRRRCSGVLRYVGVALRY